MGPEMPERGLKTSKLPVVWANFGIFRSDPNYFLSPSIDDHGPYLVTRITVPRRQNSNQWRGGIAALPAPKNSGCKYSLEKISPQFLVSRRHPPDSLFSKGPNCQRAVLLIQYLCNWRTFWRKNAAGSSPIGSCSCTTMPRLTGHWQPRRNRLTLASSVLITHHILRIRPSRTTTCSLDRKNIWNFINFLPTRRLLLPRRPGWAD